MIPKKKLEKLYKSGLSIEKIAESQKWPYYTVRYWIEKHNIPRRSRVEASFYGYWGNDKNFSRIPKRLTTAKVKDLYYQKGYSAREVGEFLDRSSSNIYKFMGKYGLKRRAPAETNSIAYIKQEPSYRLKKHLTPKEEKLKIAGIMLYWAEGYKNLGKQVRGGTIDLANSDPEMIKLFLKFLREICGVDEDRLRVFLYCYTNQNVDSLKKYWHKITGIFLEQFSRPYVRKDFLPEKEGKMRYGLAHIRYSDKKLFLQIKDWIREYLNENI